jgi:hypothetical protein
MLTQKVPKQWLNVYIRKFLFLPSFLPYCAGWGYIVAFTKVLTIYQICHTWIHPSIILLYAPPFKEEFQWVSFTYMCAQYLHHIHPPTPFSHLLPLPLIPPPHTRQDLFCPPVLWFCKRKKLHFCLFKIATQFPFEISMYIYIYIITQIGSPSLFFSFLS